MNKKEELEKSLKRARKKLKKLEMEKIKKSEKERKFKLDANRLNSNKYSMEECEKEAGREDE
jgi:hypothetical protein